MSRSYAVGMWQFMRGTGKGYGLRVDSWVDERRDPVKATDAAARHLRDLRARFGSLYLAAAAYNAGAGKVSRSLGKLEWDAPAEPSRRRTPPTDAPADAADRGAADSDSTPTAPTDTAERTARRAGAGRGRGRPGPAQDITSDAAFFRLASTDLLATETQDYVPKLIAAAIIAKAPERYGFAVPACRLPSPTTRWWCTTPPGSTWSPSWPARAWRHPRPQPAVSAAGHPPAHPPWCSAFRPAPARSSPSATPR